MLLRKELIGRNTSLNGGKIRGTIIDETKYTFIIRTGKGTKKVLKPGNVFEFESEGKKEKIEGFMLVMKPEERIKMKEPVKTG